MPRIVMRMDPATAARVLRFLAEDCKAAAAPVKNDEMREVSSTTPAEAPRINWPTRTRETGRFQFEVLGEMMSAPNGISALVIILGRLADRFPERMGAVASEVRRRSLTYIARSPAALHPGRDDLARRAREFHPGWFVDCVIANRDKQRIVVGACSALGLVFGRDVKVDFQKL